MIMRTKLLFFVASILILELSHTSVDAITKPVKNNSRGLITLVRKAPVIGTIKQKLDPGCGCSSRFADRYSKEKGTVVEYLFSDSPTIVMNIDGQDIQLRKINKSKNSQGKVVKEFYVYKNISVRIDSTLKRQYEGDSYNIKITVNRNGKSSIARAKGYCGC